VPFWVGDQLEDGQVCYCGTIHCRVRVLCSWERSQRRNREEQGQICSHGVHAGRGKRLSCRLTVCNHSQKDTIRAFTPMGAAEGMNFELMDVEGAYLAADLEEEVYVTQAEGHGDPESPVGYSGSTRHSMVSSSL